MRSNGCGTYTRPPWRRISAIVSCERHAARDLLLDEEADHLALVGGLHLLGHDHLDPVGALARLERARHLVVVGDRDRAEADPLGGVEQRVHRRRAVGRVVGVHVQVHVHEVALGEPLAQRRAARSVAWRRAAISAYSSSKRSAVRDHSSSGWARSIRAAKLAEQRRLGEQPLELGGERERVARLEQQAELAVAQRLLVLRQPRRHRARRRPPARAARAAAPARCPPTPPPRSGRARGAAPPSRPPGRRAARGRAAGAAATPPAPWPGRAARSWRASRASVGQPPQRAQEEPQGAALLLGREHDLRRRRRSARRRGGAGRRPGWISR